MAWGCLHHGYPSRVLPSVPGSRTWAGDAEPESMVVSLQTGERIHYLEWAGDPAAPPIVLIHGLGWDLNGGKQLSTWFCTTQFNPIKAVVFDFADSRGGQHARDFLGLPGEQGWRGKLVCDDFSGYKACFELGVTEVGCMAHARRKFHELWANHGSQVGEQALKFFGQLYDVEREVADNDAEHRREVRRQRSRSVADALHQWLVQQRQKVPDGSATAKGIDYSLNRWAALTRYIDDGDLPVDNNWVENQIRPIALGRNNWLFAGSMRAGKRAAAVMSLIHSARLNGLDPYAYIRDVLERLPTQPASRISELLPHRWHTP